MKLFKITAFIYLLTVLLPISAMNFFKPLFIAGQEYPIKIKNNDIDEIGRLRSAKKDGLSCVLYEDDQKKCECMVIEKYSTISANLLTITGNVTSKFGRLPLQKQNYIIKVNGYTPFSPSDPNAYLTGTCKFSDAHYTPEATLFGGIGLAGLAALTYYFWPKK